MKKVLFVCLAAALLFSACQSENLPEDLPVGALRGTIEQPVVDGFGAQTRAGFGYGFAFNWQSGDKIMVLTSVGSKAFALSTGAGTATGTFVGSLSSGETVSDKVASPYASGHALTSTSASMTLPAQYNYGSNTTFATIPIMLPCWAPIEGNAFSMNHLVGYLAFEISNIPAGANKFVLTTECKRINGAFTADLTAETPAFAAVNAAGDAEKTVTINFTASAEVTTHCFVVPVPVGTYTYDWYIKADDSLKGFGMSENIAVGRGQIKGCRVSCAEIGGGDPEPDPYNGHEYVDLGLSVKWASFNLGASKPEDYGEYYQWAGTTDVTDKSIYLNLSNCPYHSSSGWTKYNSISSYGTLDNKTVLDPEDDVAHIKLGGKWRMPTKAEWEELRNPSNCTWTWTSINGIDGYKVQSEKPDYTGNWIFLPAAGSRHEDRFEYVGSDGVYWSSSIDNTDSQSCAYTLLFCSGDVLIGSSFRYSGGSVRPVSE